MNGFCLQLSTRGQVRSVGNSKDFAGFRSPADAQILLNTTLSLYPRTMNAPGRRARLAAMKKRAFAKANARSYSLLATLSHRQ
jgi:hypothetical protein